MDNQTEPTRIIGIRHRIKRTAEGEARPTEVCIATGKNFESVVMLNLEDEQAELDFVHGIFPTKTRRVEPNEDLSLFKPHHLKMRRLKKEEKAEDFPAHLLRVVDEENFVVTRVPCVFEGLQPGDLVSMSLGGSGDNLAYALSVKAEKVGATIVRVPPFVLNDRRTHAKDRDAENLVLLVREAREFFHAVKARDRDFIMVRVGFHGLEDAMKARMATGQRVEQRAIGRIFLQPEGLYPQGTLEAAAKEAKANDVILRTQTQEEAARERELIKILEKHEVYQGIFTGLEGVGPRIGARLITAIGDVRRFSTPHKLAAYCSVHLLPDGRFVRSRRTKGKKEEGKKEPKYARLARQALYLLGEQFNRRPDSVWGKRLLENKAKLRVRHPEMVLTEDGKQRWNDLHILKTAKWRTLTQFVKWLWKRWWRLENNGQLPHGWRKRHHRKVVEQTATQQIETLPVPSGETSSEQPSDAAAE